MRVCSDPPVAWAFASTRLKGNGQPGPFSSAPLHSASLAPRVLPRGAPSSCATRKLGPERPPAAVSSLRPGFQMHTPHRRALRQDKQRV